MIAAPKIRSKNSSKITLLVVMMNAATLLGCSPEVGSEAWCEKLEKTHKADWSARDASAYARHCIFG